MGLRIGERVIIFNVFLIMGTCFLLQFGEIVYLAMKSEAFHRLIIPRYLDSIRRTEEQLFVVIHF